MFDSIQQVTSTTEFDGTSGKGLVTFSQSTLEDERPVIYSIGFDAGAPTSWTLNLVHPSGAASGIIPIDAGTSDINGVYDVRIVVPRVSATSYYELQATTTGKTETGVLTVVWNIEKFAT